MAKRFNAVTRGDVLDDLGFSRSEATALKFKADLWDAVREEWGVESTLRGNWWTSSMSISRPPATCSGGKIDQRNIEKLLRYSDRLGMGARLNVLPAMRMVTPFHNAQSTPPAGNSSG